MKESEEAKDLFVKMYQLIPDYVIQENSVASELAKQCALIAIDFAESKLTNYGVVSDELQNMDNEWRELDKLRRGIKDI